MQPERQVAANPYTQSTNISTIQYNKTVEAESEARACRQDEDGEASLTGVTKCVGK